MSKLHLTRTNEIYGKKTAQVLFCIFLVLLPISDAAFRHFLLGKEILVSCTLLLCCGLYAASCIFTRKQTAVNISYADALIILYSCILLFNSCRGTGIPIIRAEEWGAILTGYMLTRHLRIARIIPATLIVAGSIQSIIVICQKTGYMRSNHELFETTGSFINPGPLGGFIAICLTVCLCSLYNGEKQKRILRGGYIAAAGSMITALGFADSRAAFTALAAGIVFFFSQKITIFLKRYPITIPIVAVIVILSAILLFNYREKSANGRLLIWSVCTEMIAEKPVFGHGIGAFGQEYMLYQADYFKAHPGSRFSSVADDTVYPYNEFLHILTEYGTAGATVILLFLGSLFVYKPKDRTQRILKSGLFAYLWFAMFSYPISIFPLFFLFAILAGSMESRKLVTLPAYPPINKGAIVVSILICVAATREIHFYFKGSESLGSLFTEESRIAENFADKHLERLKYNDAFNDIYGMWLERHPDPEKILRLPASYNNYCYLGRTYMNRQEYSKAGECLKTASAMIPGRITSNYLLWQNALKKGDTTEAISIAKQILKQPLKVEGTFTLGVKSEIRSFLESAKSPVK